MSDETLEKLLKIVFSSEFTRPTCSDDVLELVWHAGEPLTAGLDFYKRSMQLIRQHNHEHRNLDIGIQTNGTLLNDAWCQFAKDNEIEITLSVDGPAFIHDKQRVKWNGHGSFKAVKRGMDHLRKYGLPLQAICVLTAESLDYSDEIYTFFRDEKFIFVGFNIDELEGTHSSSSFLQQNGILQTPMRDKYYNFFSRMHDLWLADGKPLEIREFQKAISCLIINKYQLAEVLPSHDTIGFASLTITKEGNISTYSPELASGVPGNIHKFTLGNVRDIEKFEDLLTNPNFLRQNNEINMGVERCARECAYFNLCGGGSPANKFYEHGTFDVSETTYCALTKKTMFDLMLDKLTDCDSLPKKNTSSVEEVSAA